MDKWGRAALTGLHGGSKTISGKLTKRTLTVRERHEEGEEREVVVLDREICTEE